MRFPRIGLVVLLISACVSLPRHCSALNLLVYNTNNAGAGSLRQSVQDNNALGGGNTIVFSNTVVGTISLVGGNLTLSTDTTIVGPGASVLTVSGANTNRVFDVTGGTVLISGLTVANGRLADGTVGAGIQCVAADLTVSNCFFSNNVTVGNFGGAICNFGNATILNSTFRTNTANGGGAIYVGGFTIISNCTFVANVSTYRGGAVWNASTARLFNCTVVSNTAVTGGGIYGNTGNPVTFGHDS